MPAAIPTVTATGLRASLLAAMLGAACVLGGCAIIVVPDEGGIHYESAFGSSAVRGNDQFSSEQRTVAALGALDVNGPLQVEVRVGAGPALQVEGDSNLLPLLRTEANGNTLRVWVEGSVRSSNALRVIYSTPQLNQVSSNGSGSMNISGLQGGSLSLSQSGSRAIRLAGRVSQFELRLHGSGVVNASALESAGTVATLNGSGRLDLGRLQGDSLSLTLHGSGGASASGNVRAATVRTHGSGSADLAGLSIESAELRAHGSGGITAAVSQSLVAEASGSGRITVYGNPVQRNVSGRHVSVLQ